jgi:alkanesulfonate monooxygenase SsuD/methylene tetrahydromethanopterin reductase-like flavin-dependent oxidoreductase (luciferase family)
VVNLKFGVVVSNAQRGLLDRLKMLEELVLEAEKLEFDAFFVTDHYMLPWSNETLEPWLYLSYLAAKTSKIKLGTCVTPIPFRPPGMLAKMVSTLDVLSGGRAILGVGIGWYTPEFEAYSHWDPNNVRFERAKEGLELIVRLWTEDKVSFEGKYYKAKDAVLLPKPLQKPRPPLWFGGAGRKMLELTAEMGDGLICIGPRWLPTYVSSEDYGKRVETVRRLRESRGKSGDFTFACIIAPHEDWKEFVREAESYKRSGMNYLILGIVRLREALGQVRRFKDEVASTMA